MFDYTIVRERKVKYANFNHNRCSKLGYFVASILQALPLLRSKSGYLVTPILQALPLLHSKFGYLVASILQALPLLQLLLSEAWKTNLFWVSNQSHEMHKVGNQRESYWGDQQETVGKRIERKMIETRKEQNYTTKLLQTCIL